MKQFKRITALVLSLVLLLTSGILPMEALAAGSGGSEAVINTETIVQNGIAYTFERKIQHVGGRTYNVTVDITSELTTTQGANRRAFAKSGYLTVEQTGWYLLELWGGDGGDGITSELNLAPDGEGGRGGYVYGKVYLEKGQTLAYSIGTDGISSLSQDDGAGGANGSGGEHGDSGSVYVGGGGGFSALFLFDVGEFNPKWINDKLTGSDVWAGMPEDVRLSRYLMIAGGGGGGGAAPWITGLLGWAINGEVYAPDGGYGGRVSSNYITLSGSSYDVEGYVFSGRDGFSSGDSTLYVGQGGSTVPGGMVETAFSGFDATQLPNDWTGTYNDGPDFGAGGSGNFRGGAGGAGFCGGSGGIMAAMLVATDVGGGGGGSSFLAKSANNQDIQFQFANGSDEATYLIGYNNQPVGNDVGGAMAMTYMGQDEENHLELENFKKLTFQTGVTDRFKILNVTTSGSATISADGSSVEVTGLDVTPRLNSTPRSVARVQMQVVARDEFAGGNGVKLLESLSASLPNPDLESSMTTVNYSLAETTDDEGNTQIISDFYVNVPLNMVARAQYLTSNEPGKSFNVTQLYEDQYTSIRSDPSANSNYEFIQSIGNYQVTNIEGDTVLTGTVSPQETTYYTVGYDVTVKPGTVETKVGPVVTDCHISATAVICVILPGNAYMSGLSVVVSKKLTSADGVYTYALTEKQTAVEVTLTEAYNKKATASGQYTVEQTGWYYIQAWGGNGGKGGYANVYDGKGTDKYGYGGDGGTGGIVSQYVYLEAGTVIDYTVGTAGSTGKNRSSKPDMPGTYATKKATAIGDGGTGGTATYVKIGTTNILIAGGGGGGGGGGASCTTYFNNSKGIEDYKVANGYDGNDSSTASGNSSYNGSSGNAGTASVSGSVIFTEKASGGPGGPAGLSYINSSYGTTQTDSNGIQHTLSSAAKTIASQLKATRSTSNGQVAFTLVETPEMEQTRQTLNAMETQMAFSRYFDVTGVTMSTTYTGSFSKTITTADDGVSSIVSIYDAKFEPGCTISIPVGGLRTITYFTEVTWNVTLKPKDGFLGGNDVPVLATDVLNCGNDTQTGDLGPNPDNSIHITQGSESYNPPFVEQTDFANVALNMDMYSIFSTKDKTIQLGESVEVTELYTFTPPTYSEADSWKDDFVEFIAPADATHSPTENTTYPLTLTMRAIDQSPEALVIAPVADKTLTLGATVYVEMPITYALNRLTTNGLEWVPYHQEYSFTLTPVQGCLLPETISVTDASGQAVANVEYDPTTGMVTLPAEAVVGPLTVTAEGRIKPYDIHIVYSSYQPETGAETQHEEIISEIQAETPLDWSRLSEIEAGLQSKPGYDYQWNYDSQDGAQPQVMPSHDLWVYGTYVPKIYEVTVNYVHADTLAQLAPPAVTEVAYGQSFSIPSPAVKGYLTDQTVISGQQGLDTLTYTVKYTPSQNTLLVVYVNGKNEQLLTQKHENIPTDSTYSFPAAVIDGYTPELDTIAGTMPGDDSVTVIVNCTPNTYNLNFVYSQDAASGYDPLPGVDLSGATMAGGSSQKVEYDNKYGYNAETDVFTGLPKPEIAGYAFTGWYSDPSLTTAVSENDIYKATVDTTLYAGWSAQTFQLTVEYKFDYEEGDFVPEKCENESSLDVTGDFLGTTFASDTDVQAYLNAYAAAYSQQHGDLRIAYGTAYTIPIPAIEGYTAYLRYGLNDSETVQQLTGTMLAANRKIIVTYVINLYTVRFLDHGWQTVNYSDAATVDAAVYQADTFDTLWATVEQVKHGAAVAYGGVLPNQATKETYTYTFTGWKSGLDGTVYPGQTPEFPVVKQDTDYYACYDAQENIISTYISAVDDTQYFTNVADAIAYAETNYNGTVNLIFRRNSGNEKTVDLDGDILEFGKTYTGTTALSFTVDLNGLQVGSDTGSVVLVNPSDSYINLSVTSTGSQGTLYSRGSGDVVTAQVQRQLTLNSNVVLEATSTGGKAVGISSVIDGTAAPASVSVGAGHVKVTAAGDAIGIQCPSSISTSTSSSYQGITVDSTGGKAIGVEFNSGSRTINSIKLTVNGREAVGVLIPEGTACTVSGSTVKLTADGQTSAVGILVEQGGTLTCGSYAATAAVTAANGTAYGIRNFGTVTNPNTELTVDATNGNAYGFANEGGTVTLSGTSTSLKLGADSTGGQGYGLYSSGGSVGSSTDYLDNGVISGSSYGIYCTDGSIFVSGNDLYFKGATEDTALLHSTDTQTNVVIAEGYEQTEAYEPYVGYYRLARWHTITFETNGGTELAEIKQLFGTPLDSNKFVTTMRGYDFVDWHTNAELTEVYTVPEWMPDEDLDLYAQWLLLDYRYTLDTEITNMTVQFYGVNYGDTDLVAEATLSTSAASLPENIQTENMTYKSGTTLYIHAGWYTEEDVFVNLSGDLSPLDTDGDGIIKLYSKWITQSSCQNYSTYDDYAMMGTSAANAASVYITYYHQILSSYTGSGYAYMYYVIPEDGDYAVNYANYKSGSAYSSNSYYYQYVQIQKRSGNTTTTLKTDSYVNLYRNKAYSSVVSSFKAGDVVVLRARKYYNSTSASYYTYIHGFVSPVNTDTVPSYNVSAKPDTVQVEFYGAKSGQSDLVYTAQVTPDGVSLPSSVQDLTYKSGTTLYIHTGWYTDDGTYVDLSGDISALDTDGDGVVKLTSKWLTQSNCQNYSTSYQDYRKMGSNLNAAGNIYVTGYHRDSSSYGNAYMYYVVPKDGTYTVNYGNYNSSSSDSSTYYSKYLRIQKISGSTITTIRSESSLYANKRIAYEAYEGISCKAGDVIVFKAYRYYSSTVSSYNSYIYGYVSEDVPVSNDYQVSSPLVKECYIYNVEMGDVTLPILTENNTRRFSGWSEGTASVDSADWIMTLTPAMVDDPNLPWESGQVMNLYANWLDPDWLGYQAPDRDFSAITGTNAVTVRSDETVTLRFQATDTAAAAQSLAFERDLTEGTVLTLVNRTTSPHSYYTYTVGAGGLNRLQLKDFVNMATGAVFYANTGIDMLLQIDYSHASAPAVSQKVSLWADAMTPEARLSYQLIGSQVVEEELTANTLTYLETGKVSLDVPALTGKGLDATDVLYLRVSWGSLKLVPGVQIQVDDSKAVLLDGSYGLIKLDTVADHTADYFVTLTYSFPTSVYWDCPDGVQEFTQAFTYELVVMPANTPEHVLFDRNGHTVGKYTQTITVTPTPAVTADTHEFAAQQGETLTLGTFSYTERSGADVPAFYVYSNVDGFLEVTDACQQLFDNTTVQVDENGKLTNATLTDGTLAVTVSQDAVAGEYYLKFVYDDKYVFVLISVSPLAS